MSQVPVVAAVITASAAVVVGLVATVQKWVTDQRDAWWKRAQWAIDKSLSADPEQRDIGNQSLGVLAAERLRFISDADLRVLQIAALRAFVDTR